MTLLKTKSNNEWQPAGRPIPNGWNPRPMLSVDDVKARVAEPHNFVHCVCGRWAVDPPAQPCGCPETRAMAEGSRRALQALRPRPIACELCGKYGNHECRPAVSSGPASLDAMNRRTHLAALKSDLEALGMELGE